MKRHIYAIYDRVAHDILGNLICFPADAPAVRWFGDIAGRADTIVAQHPEDYELIKLGSIFTGDRDEPVIQPTRSIVLTGSAWLAAQNAPRSDQPNGVT